MRRFEAYLSHYLPLLFLIASLVLLAYTSVEFYKSHQSLRVVNALPLENFLSVDRIPVIKINGKTIGVLAVEKGKSHKKSTVWIKNMSTHKVKKFRIGQNIFKSNVHLTAIKKGRLELKSKSGMHHLLLRK